mmetsp:Transcript_27000/g.50420  ORF Transcript_27000/g.50420 Transcript_27000/m.50420 type:complete len:80 (+) Transcript_27000:42-281(+)
MSTLSSAESKILGDLTKIMELPMDQEVVDIVSVEYCTINLLTNITKVVELLKLKVQPGAIVKMLEGIRDKKLAQTDLKR